MNKITLHGWTLILGIFERKFLLLTWGVDIESQEDLPGKEGLLKYIDKMHYENYSFQFFLRPFHSTD